jgi:hypothetical protein
VRFNSPTDYTDDGYENRNAHFNNNEIKGNEELMLFILDCTLLHIQNDGWTSPYP